MQESLKKAQIEAAKARDQVRLDTIRMVISALKYRCIEKGKEKELELADVYSVLNSLCKQRREAIEKYEQGGRNDLVAKEKRELEILQSFLPPQLTKEEVMSKVREVIASTGAQSAKEMGKVMKVVMADLAGKADGSLVSSVVKELLK
ncbi:MAG: GatB/YqeY domain-containing protein [Deltaproteobacteria bacterium]|nr:GatB/YqeY domain-containing protein [Deltaproteobacteria bacterium]MBI2500102.1 GatB/YqeY domain-containing protein [Deltaproteobacteria bacterium]MBI4197120.1 GatB/YqeY domain-containing protein [Deltaproteobacteria bacterium]